MNPNQHNAYFAQKRKNAELDKKKAGAWAYLQDLKDQEEARQHRFDMSNVCPKCFIVRNSARQCVMGCDINMDEE